MFLSELEPMIHRLAEKVWSVSHQEPRVARTVVLKLKTSGFQTVIRSVTPGPREELTAMALSLRERVDLGSQQRFRLVGVGLANFREPEEARRQPALFEAR